MNTFSPSTVAKSADVNQNFTDLSTGDADTTANSLRQHRTDDFFDHVISGGVWTPDSAGVNRNASMSAMVVGINGRRITISAVTSRNFTASKDVYVDVLDNADGTGTLVYTDQTTNGASPSLASNSLRLAIVVVGASSIAAAASINQGQEDRVLPIASSIPYTVTDSIGNLICPRDPQRRIIGYRQITSDFGTTSTSDVTGLNLNCIIPANRKVKVMAYTGLINASVVNNGGTLNVIDVTASVTVAQYSAPTNASGDGGGIIASTIRTFSSGVRNFKTTITRGTNAATSTIKASTSNVAYLLVELV